MLVLVPSCVGGNETINSDQGRAICHKESLRRIIAVDSIVNSSLRGHWDRGAYIGVKRTRN